MSDVQELSDNQEPVVTIQDLLERNQTLREENEALQLRVTRSRRLCLVYHRKLTSTKREYKEILDTLQEVIVDKKAISSAACTLARLLRRNV